MKEVRSPKRPLLYYYLIALGVILLFNMLVMPVMSMNQVLEVDYGTFVQMAEDKNLGQVEVDETENQILFTDKDQTTIYKAGMIPDPDLARLLKDSGAKYGGQIIEQTNPILSFLLSWVLPIAIFIFLAASFRNIFFVFIPSSACECFLPPNEGDSANHFDERQTNK